MSDESPGATIRRARQEARMKQRELADRMGVHATTVGLWERDKFFPEQHWAALNKLLHINLSPPGAAAGGGETAERGPGSTIDAGLLAALRSAYRGEPEKLREAVDALEAIEAVERERGESRGEGRSRPERHAG